MSNLKNMLSSKNWGTRLRALWQMADGQSAVESALAGSGIVVTPRPNNVDALNVGALVSDTNNHIKLAFSPVFTANPSTGTFWFVAGSNLTGVAAHAPDVQFDSNAPMPLKDAVGNNLLDKAWVSGQVVTFTVAGGEARMSNWIQPRTENFFFGNAIWDAGNNRYNVTTGQGINTAPVNQHFRIVFNADNQSGGTYIKIDGMPSRLVRYKYKTSGYNLLAGEVKKNSELLVRWDGSNFILIDGLSVPDIVIRGYNTSANAYTAVPDFTWYDLTLTNIPTNDLVELTAGKLVAKQPMILEVRGTTRFKDDNVSARIKNNGVDYRSYSANTGEHYNIMESTIKVVSQNEIISIECNAYANTVENKSFRAVQIKFIGRP